MRTFILVATFICLSLVSLTQTSNDIFPSGKVDSVYSKILGEQRTVWIYSPTMKPGNKYAGQRFPVIYLIDGDAHFEGVVAMIRQLSEIDGNTSFPPMIVVAILNTDRTRDLTPIHIINDLPILDSSDCVNTGGNEKFIAFMQNELMPHIDSLYPVQPFKLMIGHSFGGLTAMNILTNHTKMFNAYIAIDPSMWFGHEAFLKATEKKLEEKNYAGTKLYIGIANTMPEGMNLEKLKKDTTSGTRHIRSIFALNDFIKKHPNNGLAYASNYYEDDDHGSVPFISEYEGLRFIFHDYKLKFSIDDFLDSSTAIIKKIRDHYESISKQFGYSVLPPQDMINDFAMIAMSKKFIPRTIALFKMNVENYPNSEDANYAFGSAFLYKKDTANALLYFQKAYSINESQNTLHMINALNGKKVFELTTDALEKYSGIYVFEAAPITATVYLKDSTLWISSPGDGEYELVPVAPDIFTIKNKAGYTL
ncbi:MAG: alpha/beta hydrolase-fold protein, partial [Bacteroidota bacterium]